MRNQKHIFDVTVPEIIFPGFYDTEFDPDNVLTNEDGEEYTGEEENYYELVENYEKDVVERIINHYKEVLPKDFKIVEYKLYSPEYYNYSNDHIDLSIECSYEDILYHFFNYKEEDLLYYLELDNYSSDNYHEAMLEVLLSFWPFTGDLTEIDLYEKFIYW